jgi:hypothetical protein
MFSNYRMCMVHSESFVVMICEADTSVPFCKIDTYTYKGGFLGFLHNDLQRDLIH